jgi:penicillin-binding protein 1A
MGYDHPRSLGDSAQAALYTAPIFREFMRLALKDKPDPPFRVPAGIKLVSVDPRTGLRASGAGSILEAFKPGTAPPDAYVASDDQNQTSAKVLQVTPDLDREIGSGTGGLY